MNNGPKRIVDKWWCGWVCCLRYEIPIHKLSQHILTLLIRGGRNANRCVYIYLYVFVQGLLYNVLMFFFIILYPMVFILLCAILFMYGSWETRATIVAVVSLLVVIPMPYIPKFRRVMGGLYSSIVTYPLSLKVRESLAVRTHTHTRTIYIYIYLFVCMYECVC